MENLTLEQLDILTPEQLKDFVSRIVGLIDIQNENDRLQYNDDVDFKKEISELFHTTFKEYL